MPHLIPSMEPECHRIFNDLLDKARGKTRIDVVDEYAYPLPVTVICKILGVPLKDEPMFHNWIATGWRASTSARRRLPKRGSAALRRARGSWQRSSSTWPG